MNENFVYRFENNLYVNLTNRCCNACVFCIRNNGDGIGDSGDLWLRREPSAAEVTALVDGEKRDYEELVFCGYGEPTYRTDALVEVGRHAREKGIVTRLNTNGLGSLICGRDIVPDLAAALDKVSVSLNADNAEEYQRLCRSEFGIAAYDAMLDFTARCVRAGIDSTLSIVAGQGVDLDRCRRIAASVGARLRVREYIP